MKSETNAKGPALTGFMLLLCPGLQLTASPILGVVKMFEAVFGNGLKNCMKICTDFKDTYPQIVNGIDQEFAAQQVKVAPT